MVRIWIGFISPSIHNFEQDVQNLTFALYFYVISEKFQKSLIKICVIKRACSNFSKLSLYLIFELSLNDL